MMVTKKGVTKGMLSNSFHQESARRVSKIAGIVFVMFASTILVPAPVMADMVSGRVFGAEGKFQPKDSFEVKDSSGKVLKVVKTDESKAYSVFLQPGSYTVEFKDKDNTIWQAPLQSYPQAARQDIHLSKR